MALVHATWCCSLCRSQPASTSSAPTPVVFLPTRSRHVSGFCVVSQQCSRSHQHTAVHAVVTDVAAEEVERMPAMPFVRLAGQEEMKTAVLLNLIDPRIGGVLIMGDRGTGKSVTVGDS
jgi:hypothetical protein